MDAKSKYPYYIIGVDVQGDSEGLLVRENFINLVNGLGGPIGSDRLMGVRVRRNVDRGTILFRTNLIDEGILFQRGELKKYEEKVVTGGCPFTQGRVFAPANENPHANAER